jgi:DNA-binding NarL/FixJ family response regulator
MKWARILIADDHLMFAEGLHKLLESEFDCVGIVNDGVTLLHAVETLQPHVVLLDISMPQLSGLDVAAQIHRRYPDIKLIFVTMHKEPEYLSEGLHAGALGYILKSSAGSELLTGIGEVLRGRRFISAELNSVVASAGGQDIEGLSLYRSLTPRQRQVLQLLCEGNPMKVIAHALNISMKTVEFHKAAMMRALGAQNTAELIRIAVEQRLLT